MAQLTELLHLVARWVHLIAGIMWIGNSMLFNWLDRNLELPENPKAGLVGEIWMVHSGGFYQVEKKFLPAGQMPKTLHWFKWQNGITWLSGIALLILVYYMGGAALMTDPTVANISPGKAVFLGVSTLVAGWLAYDAIWRSPLGKNSRVGFALSVAVVLALAAVQFHWLSGRAAYMHVGVMLGTIMTGNVWFVIMPSQRELIAATLADREQDPAIGYQAKQRSIHNNYITFPLLFIMLNNHFPETFGNKLNWLVLLVLALGSAGIRHLMNIRFTYRNWLLPATLTFFATCVATLFFFAHPEGLGHARRATSSAQAVTWNDVQPIFRQRCQRCHSRQPTDAAFRTAPNGVVFDQYDDVVRMKDRVKLRAVTLRSMPLANMTGMTDAERERVGAWVDQGAKEN